MSDGRCEKCEELGAELEIERARLRVALEDQATLKRALDESVRAHNQTRENLEGWKQQCYLQAREGKES